MSGAWARPIESVLEEPLDRHLTAEAVRRLAVSGIAEGALLDFKGDRYQKNEASELAKDILAFANARGGVLVLGVFEPDQVGAPGVPRPLAHVGDEDARWIRSITFKWCAPVPEIEVIVVADGPAGEGFILIVVPPSPRAPHAICPPGGNRLSWPLRRGTQTDWLYEADIADQYARRLARQADEAARVSGLVTDAVNQLADEGIWLVTVLLPAGRAPTDPISTELITRYQNWLFEAWRATPAFYRAARSRPGRAGARRVVFGEASSATSARPHFYDFVELHTDGAAVIADQLTPAAGDEALSMRSIPENAIRVPEQVVAECALIQLLLASRHALENAGAWAEGSVVYTLTEGQRPTLSAPVALTRQRYEKGVRFGADVVGIVPAGRPAPVFDLTIDLAAVALEPRRAVAAAHRLASGLVNVFGVPEIQHFSAEGAIHLQTFDSVAQPRFKAWYER